MKPTVFQNIAMKIANSGRFFTRGTFLIATLCGSASISDTISDHLEYDIERILYPMSWKFHEDIQNCLNAADEKLPWTEVIWGISIDYTDDSSGCDILVNIFVGDPDLGGPRPVPPDIVDKYELLIESTRIYQQFHIEFALSAAEEILRTGCPAETATIEN